MSQIKAKIVVNFDEHYNAINYFKLKDDKLYWLVFKIEQYKIFILYNYSTVNIIEKVYT